MSERPETQRLWEELMSRDVTIGSHAAATLGSLALQEPDLARSATSALRQTLHAGQAHDSEPSGFPAMDTPDTGEKTVANAASALANIAIYRPALVASEQDTLVQCTGADAAATREGAYRALGALARAESVDQELLVDHLSNGASSDSTGIQQTVAWGLSKAGLTSPSSLSGVREPLVRLLAITDSEAREATDTSHSPWSIPSTELQALCSDVRRHAVEAIAIRATTLTDSDVSIRREQIEAPENVTELAARGIERFVIDNGLPDHDTDVEIRSRSPAHDHGIAPPLARALAHTVSDNNTHSATTLAAYIYGLAYLVPGHEDLREALAVLSEQAPSYGPQTLPQIAALRGLYHGPFGLAESTQRTGANCQPVELTVKPANDIDMGGCSVHLPVNVHEGWDLSKCVVKVCGDESRVLRPNTVGPESAWFRTGRQLEPGAGIIRADESAREKAEMTVGDSVYVMPKPLESARCVEMMAIEYPEQIDSIDHDRIRSYLEGEPVVCGDHIMIPASIASSTGSVADWEEPARDETDNFILKVSGPRPGPLGLFTSDTLLEVDVPKPLTVETSSTWHSPDCGLKFHECPNTDCSGWFRVYGDIETIEHNWDHIYTECDENVDCKECGVRIGLWYI